MKYQYPTPREVGLLGGHGVIQADYDAGFEHGLRGGNLDRIEFLKKSFRLGFRAAKLYLKDLRKKQGISNFPLQGRLKVRAF